MSHSFFACCTSLAIAPSIRSDRDASEHVTQFRSLHKYNWERVETPTAVHFTRNF